MEENVSGIELKESNLLTWEFRIPNWWIGDPKMDGQVFLWSGADARKDDIDRASLWWILYDWGWYAYMMNYYVGPIM